MLTTHTIIMSATCEKL